MTKYSRKPLNPERAVFASLPAASAHFKNTYEAATALKGRSIVEARRYLEDVRAHKQCIPVRRFNSHVGRTGQATQFGVTQGRWFHKSVEVLLGLVRNLEANAASKQLDVKKLFIRHVQVNRAPHGRRRTYRAHGRITPYLSSPCHIQLFAEEPLERVPKPERPAVGRMTPRKVVRSKIRRFLAVGGDKR